MPYTLLVEQTMESSEREKEGEENADRKKRNDAIIILIEREAGEHKEKQHSACAAAKVKGELEADDCCNSAPGENHPLHKAQSLTGTGGGSCMRGRGS